MVSTRRNAGFTFALAILLGAACSPSGQLNSSAGVGGDTSATSGNGGSSTTGSGTSASGGTGGNLFSGATSTATGQGGGTTVSSGAGGTGGEGCAMMPPVGAPSPEACGDGLDNDLNGFVDEGCVCNPGQTQTCFGGPPTWLAEPNCMKGTQTCQGNEFPGWGPCQGWACGPVPPAVEICDNLIDDDCDNLIDEGCALNMMVNIDDDCVYASCPPQAPYPIGCNIMMDGGDSRGCVASTPASPLVYFKEGDACPIFPGFPGAGHVSGTLTCSTVMGMGLNAQNCPINKPNKFYPPDKSGCP